MVASSLLPSEGAAFCESGLATGGLTEDGRAASADDDGLGVGEDSCDCKAARALDVHEKRSRGRNKSLQDPLVRYLVWRDTVKARQLTYLQLVLAGLSLRSRVEKIDCENLWRVCQQEISQL